MKHRQKIAHMKAAYVYADLSYCQRKKVGCIIVKDNRVISIGYNGTEPGEDNTCEDEFGNTKPDVVHAEDNALRKLIQSTECATGSSVFITTSPCIGCAKKLRAAGVKEVFYDEIYRDTKGLEYLKKHGINVKKISIKDENK